MSEHQEYAVAAQEEFARATNIDNDELTVILSVVMQGDINAFASTMAMRLGLRDARHYLSLLLNGAIMKTMDEVGWSPDQAIHIPPKPDEPNPQLYLDLEEDIPF